MRKYLFDLLKTVESMEKVIFMHLLVGDFLCKIGLKEEVQADESYPN